MSRNQADASLASLLNYFRSRKQNGHETIVKLGFGRYFHLYHLFTIYHQGFFHSVGRNPSLNCLHRRRSLAILDHAGPRWRIRLSLHLVLGLPCRLVHSRGVHYVTLFVHLCPAHPCIPFLITSMISFTPV